MTHLLGKWIEESRSEDGQALAEYALILAFVTIVCVAALTALGIAIGLPLGDAVSAFGGGGS
jgi:Flp pilus assembly pilin Flp